MTETDPGMAKQGDAGGPTDLAAPAPGQPEPLADEPAGSRWLAAAGFLVLTGCLLVGEWVKARLGLVLPGSILGLFLLLTLLLTGVVPLRWVQGAARLLLWLLPFLFLPIFILAMRDKAFWAVQGRALAGAVGLGTVALWAVVGHLSQSLLRKRTGDEAGTGTPTGGEGRGDRPAITR